MIGRQRWAHLVFLIVTTGGRDTETAENDRRYSEDTTTFPQRSPWCAYYGQHWLQPLVRNGTATPLGPRPEEKKRKVRDDVPPAKAGSLPCSKYCCAQLVSLLFFVFFLFLLRILHFVYIFLRCRRKVRISTGWRMDIEDDRPSLELFPLKCYLKTVLTG